MSIARRLRGIGFTMLAWGAVWALAGKAFYPLWYRWLEWANHGPHCWSFFANSHAWGGWGAFGGLAFALLLLARGRGGGIDALRMTGFAASGALGGAALPLLNLGMTLTGQRSSDSDLGLAILIGAALGAGCAAGALTIARRDARPLGA
jgi:hypothetical protein